MIVEFTLDKKAAAVFEKMLDDRRKRGLSMWPVFAAVAADFSAVEHQAFATQGRSIGASWRPLSSWWLQFRLRHGLGSKILHYENARGGRLERSLTFPGAPWSLRKVTEDSVTVGTSLGIARLHQQGGQVAVPAPGGKKRSVTIPRRRLVQMRRQDKDRWIAYAQEWISTGRVAPGRLRGL